MRHRPLSLATVLLTIGSLACAALASLVTVSWNGAFAGSTQALAEARGWSVVTLAVVVPLGLWAVRQAVHGVLRGQLVLLGVLGYLAYTYLEMAVSPPFTALYLVYIATFAMAIPALIMAVAAIDLDETVRAVGERWPRRRIAAFALVMGGGLAFAWLGEILPRTFAGEFGWPSGDAQIRHVVQALDLGLQVPLSLATFIAIVRRSRAQVVLASITLVNGLTMGLALLAMVIGAQGLLAALPFALIPAAAMAFGLPLLRRLPSPVTP